MPASLTQRHANWVSRQKKWWLRSTSTPILQPRLFRWRWTPQSRTGESSAATLLCSKQWVVALHGARQRSGIEKSGISGDKLNCRRVGIPLRKRNRNGGGTPLKAGEKHGRSRHRARG